MNRCLVFGSGSAGIRHARNARSLGIETKIISKRELEEFQTFKTLENALSSFKPDFAIVANRTSEHLDDLGILVQEKIPALIEKPLTTKVSHQLNNLIDLINHQQLQNNYRVAYLMRYHPLVIQLNKDIESLGKINYVNSQYSHYLPWWRSHGDFKKSYSASRDQGGGVMYDSSHEIDLIQFLFGKVESVSGILKNYQTLGIESDELSSLSLELEENVAVDISLDYLSRIPVRTMRIEGKEGTVILDFIKENYFINTSEDKEVRKIDFEIDRNQIFMDELKSFIYNLNDCLLPNINDSLETVKIFDLVQESNIKRKWIRT